MASKLFFNRTKHVDPVPTASEGRADVPTARALGLRTCAEPQNLSKAVDIVFVHGLTGDREKTWTHQSNERFWPEALLSSDLPQARIFTYGYDADVAHFFSPVSQSRIGDHAQTLLSRLKSVRERTETRHRPLFFVAHSLGGLVVEDMLLNSKNSAESDRKQILESTEGIAFMGTPHCGSQFADWAKVFSSVAKLINRLNQSMITVLRPDSEVLARIQQEFHTMIRARNEAGKSSLRLMCFYEDHDLPGIGPVVPKHSAILPGYNAISIAADHMGMTKFEDENDPGYQDVLGELWTWIRDVNKKAEQSGSVEAGGEHKDSFANSARPMNGVHFLGSNNHVGGGIYQAHGIGTLDRSDRRERWRWVLEESGEQ